MAQTSSITILSMMVGIVGRASAVEEKCDFWFVFFVCYAFELQSSL